MTKAEKNNILWFSAVFFLALILRLHFIFNVEYPLMGDAENYLDMARRIAYGESYGYLSSAPDAYVTPVYPLFLASFLSLFGESGGVITVQILQCVIGSITAVLCMLFAKKLLNIKAGIMAGSLAAIYPPFIMSSLCLLTECLYLFIFMCYFYLQLLSLDLTTSKKALIMSALAGILFALAVLTRPTVLPLSILPYVYKLITVRKDDKTVKKFVISEAVIFSVFVILTMLPWWIRNAVVLGRFIPLTDGSGNPLLFGSFPNMEIPTDFYVPREEELSLAIERIKNGFLNEPVKYFLWYTAGKFKYIFFNIWYYLPGPVSPPYYNNLLPFVHYFTVAVGWLSVIFSTVFGRIRFISIYALSLTALQLCFIPNERYAYTIIPLLMISASVFTVYCFSAIRHEKKLISPRI